MIDVAIYVRLSEEDRDKLDKNEDSESILNQRNMLCDYAKNRGWNIVNIYSDDDYSGSDNTRPGFNAMLTDASNRKFQILLCKSLSRFARDVSLVETYINGYFIEWGIRFISITDYADTSLKGNRKNIQINSLVNQWYLEDLSENIRSVMHHKKKQGQYTGGFAPYGYVKDPNDSHKLIVDPEASEIVKKIFQMYLDGHGNKAIANELNLLNVSCPCKYRVEKGFPTNRDAEKAKSLMWSDHAVWQILQNPNYTGDLVQCRYRKPTYKSKNIKPTKKEDWIVVENAHEAIVSKNVFESVQQYRQQKRTYKRNANKESSPNIFSGLITCKICMRSLVTSGSGIRNKGTRYFRCTGRKSGISNCDCAMVKYDTLVEIITNEIRQLINRYCDFQELGNRIHSKKTDYESELMLLVKNKDRIIDEQNKLDKALSNSYLDKSTGTISVDDFTIISNQLKERKNNIADELISIEKRIEKIESLKSSDARTNLVIDKYKNFPELSRELLLAFVERIYIGSRDKNNPKDFDIDIYWNV